MRKKLATLGATALFLAMGVGTAVADSPVIAQEQTNTDQQADNNDDGGNAGLWGLAGLLGLAGLAGRKRDDRDHQVHQDRSVIESRL